MDEEAARAELRGKNKSQLIDDHIELLDHYEELQQKYFKLEKAVNDFKHELEWM